MLSCGTIGGGLEAEVMVMDQSVVHLHQYHTSNRFTYRIYRIPTASQSRSTHHAVGHQSSLQKTSQDIGGMVLVVRDPGQAGVEGHHDERELGQRAQQAGAVPGETGLQVKLGGAKTRDLLASGGRDACGGERRRTPTTR